ncbi:MAG: HlyD family secretion protein [Proteobacteria bacterium]|nr:HlyD family secretion protein [Pseudomonadota bacterium]
MHSPKYFAPRLVQSMRNLDRSKPCSIWKWLPASPLSLTTGSPHMSETRKKILPVLIAGAGLIVVYFVYDKYMYIHSDNAQIEAHTVMLATKVAGFVTEVKAEIGERMKSGDVLATIDDRDYVTALERAKADLESTDVRLQDAQKNFNRLTSLYGKGAATQAQLESATAAFNDLKARSRFMKSQVDQAQLNLESTKIKAPFDGFVARRAAEVGQYATASTPLFGFVEGSERWVMCNLKETEIGDISEGNKVDITVDAISGLRFTGKVQQVSPSTGATFTMIPPDNATGNFTKVVQRVPIKISIDGATADEIFLLRAGLSADVRVHRHKP